MESPPSPHPGRRFFGPDLENGAGTFGALDFHDVTLRIFPLRVSLQRLETFVDAYVQADVPEQIARFRPAMPWVFFMVVHYGRMSPAASTLGWVSQNEVLFSVPLLGRWSEGEETVEGWASVSPVIFVDDEWSIATGREVYGWPKVLASLSPEVDVWLRDPRQPRQLMTLKTRLFPELYAGRRMQDRVLLEVRQSPSGIGQVPPSLSDLLLPLTRMPQALLDTWAMAPDLAAGLQRLGSSFGAVELTRRLSSFVTALASPDRVLRGTAINLKQFRSSKPDSVCYQALVASRLVFRGFHAGGLLGGEEQLRADPTGGFSIRIHDDPAYPIVDSFGLVVDQWERTAEDAVAELTPLVPFWLSVDLRYELGRRICWRTEDHVWTSGTGPALGGMTPASRPQTTSTPYNNALGPVAQAPEGPFDFFDATLRVLPLRARVRDLLRELPIRDPRLPASRRGPGDLDLGERLAALYDSPALAAWDGFRFEPHPGAGSDLGEPHCLVFLVATSYGRMSAAVNDVGWWASREVGFAVLLRTRLTGDPGGSRYWLYWPYVFADSPIAVTEGREVLGLPTTFAALDPGRDPWMEPTGLDGERRLLALSAKDLPAVGVGQGSRSRRLLEIRQRPSAGARDGRETLVERFRRARADDYRTGLRYSNLSLKQIRDEETPDGVCYRAIVAFERSIGKWAGGEPELAPLPGRYEVRLHDSPGFPILQHLGLEVDRAETDERGATVAVCAAEEPFWLQVDMRSHLSTELAYQAVDGVWRVGRRGGEYLEGRLRGDALTTAGPPRAPEAPQPAPPGGPHAPEEPEVPFDRTIGFDSFRPLESLVEDVERLREESR